MRFFINLLSCCFLLFLITCKEDRDDVAPLVTILEPVENTTYNVLESVGIRANVSDNNKVESVRISLISEATNNQVLSSKTFVVNQKEAVVEHVIELSDSLLETGRYYLRAEAFDGENYLSGFRFIKINGIQKKKLGIIVSCANGSTTDVYTDQNNFNFQLLTGFSQSYQATVFNASDQQLWFAPSNGNELHAYSLAENTVVYSNRYNSNFTNALSDLELEGRDVLIGLTQSEVDGRSHFFSDSYTYLAASERKIGQIAANDTYVLVEEVDKSGSNRAINVLRRNGSLRSSSVFNEDIVEMIFTKEDECIILSNNAQGGRGVVFDLITGNVLNTLFTTDNIRSAVKTNSGNLYLSTSSGVKHYTLQNGSLVDYVNQPNAVLAYDVLSNQLLIGQGRTLGIYTYPHTTPSSSGTLPNNIVGIDIRYNKN